MKLFFAALLTTLVFNSYAETGAESKSKPDSHGQDKSMEESQPADALEAVRKSARPRVTTQEEFTALINGDLGEVTEFGARTLIWSIKISTIEERGSRVLTLVYDKKYQISFPLEQVIEGEFKGKVKMFYVAESGDLSKLMDTDIELKFGAKNTARLTLKYSDGISWVKELKLKLAKN